MKRAVITGATGDIGVALIQNLISRGVEILALIRKHSARADNIPKHPLVKVNECDLDELSTIDFDGKAYDVFYHLGWNGTYGVARNDYYVQCDNIRYTLDAIAAAKRLGCKVFVGAGSQAEYGRVDGVLSPETPTFPENGYGIAKLAAGKLAKEYSASIGLHFCWVRIVSVYGPLGNNLVASTVKKLKAGERVAFTKGEQLWDFLHCADAAEALRCVGERGVDGRVYVLGYGTSRTLREYIEDIAKAMDALDRIDIGALPYADRQVMHLAADISELTADTGWKPQIKFKEGIKKVKESIQKQMFAGGGAI